MSTKKKNLSETKVEMAQLENAKIAVITSMWNENITMSLKNACIDELYKFGCKEDDILSYAVPGAFELPPAAKMVLSNKKIDAIICIGCVIKGETKHDEYICNAVSAGIMNLSILSGKPVIFGVLTPNDMQQAVDRSGGKYGNKGIEAAHTAIQMIHLSKSIKNGDKEKIGFS